MKQLADNLMEMGLAMKLKVKRRIPEYIEKWAYVDILGGLAGIIGGLSVVVFKLLIGWSQKAFMSMSDLIKIYFYDFNLAILIIIFIGGLMVGLITSKIAPEVRGHGLPEIMEAIHLKGGVMNTKNAFARILASAITLGSGGSAGRVGPTIQIGATICSFLSRTLRLPMRMAKLLIVCGLSSSVAGLFNAPVAGAIFGIEVIYRRLEPMDIIPILIASFTGSIVSLILIGDEPLINIEYAFISHPIELVFHVILGLITGLIAILWIRILYLIEDLFIKIRIPKPIKPAIGGLIAGSIGILIPDYGVLGLGYEGIEAVLNGELTISLLLIILGLMKMIATSLTLGSGGCGGIFAPTIYIGCMIGGGIGLLIQDLIPSLTSQCEIYPLIGMASMIAGTLHAPLTALILIPEMTECYELLIPLIISSPISYFISWTLMDGSSIYTLKLERKGINIKLLTSPLFETLTVNDIMRRNILIMKADMPISLLEVWMIEHEHGIIPVVLGDKIIGIITIKELEKISFEEGSKVKAKDIISRDFTIINSRESLISALNIMNENDTDKLLVVNENNEILGIIFKEDILTLLRKFKT